MDPELRTSAQMRALEAAAMAEGYPGREMMERAGAETVAAIFESFPDLADLPGEAVILCGPGGNGGDGYVIARRLVERGWRARVLALGRPAEGGDAQAMEARWRAMGGVVAPLDDAAARAFAAGEGGEPALVVDALFGIGLSRPPEGPVEALLADAACYGRGERGERWVAVDVPSGLCADSGRALGAAVEADLTVTFHAAKLGHHLADGPALCGRLAVRDIGLGPWLPSWLPSWPFAVSPPAARPAPRVPDDAAARGVGWTLQADGTLAPRQPETATEAERAAAAEAAARFAARTSAASPAQAPSAPPPQTPPARLVSAPTAELLAKRAGDHKYGHGHVLVLSGGVGRGGAARMAARAALRAGAGLVTLGCPPAALIENAARLDAVMLRPVKDADALSEMLEDRRLNALVLGPGLGAPERARLLVEAALAAGRSTVLDADALTAFAEAPETLFERLHRGALLTPHMGEFARLFPDLAERLAEPPTRGPALSRLDVVREAAARAGAGVLLKGADTVIAGPDGRAWIHSAAYGREAPWLATAGAGDVLAGIAAGLMARGFTPAEAAKTAAWLHVEAARRFGPGLIAEDLAEQLPGVLRDLLAPGAR
ncbi:NAD(P)H-hydrate dehydratase [Albimonas sp. CAU 1670]|uniref:NAD(P)H-hydrate dehydratase n=1 Tax=Albimonas sp. CAU 1670 TaxID=3032599 RepID=UPI0023D99267|nr:NAD(P)H-hydrate dehydratase [Albimonas sp. CAU 1670]MDF2234244.1 NAD(P)H-hydrate dehydratase [Albimonas sp. CAU 1670]